MLIDAKFPGILQKMIKAVDKMTNNSLTRLKEKLSKYEKLWQVMKTIMRIVSLELIYVDIFKDTSVIVIIVLVGGPTAVINFLLSYFLRIELFMCLLRCSTQVTAQIEYNHIANSLSERIEK